MITTDAEIQAVVDEELRTGDKRSVPYRLAMIDVLRLRILRIQIPMRYEPGTVEFDAYYSGNTRGHALWRAIQENKGIAITTHKAMLAETRRKA
jgi:hypothetical protein